MTWTKINPEDLATFPKSGQRVLFVALIAPDNHEVHCFGEWDSQREKWFDVETDGYNDRLEFATGEVTHWQPLPALPGEETEHATARYALAARAVEAICNDRRGLHWGFDDDTKAELREQLARMIRCAVEGAKPDDDYDRALMRSAREELGT